MCPSTERTVLGGLSLHLAGGCRRGRYSVAVAAGTSPPLLFSPLRPPSPLDLLRCRQAAPPSRTLFLIFLARATNCRVESVSSLSLACGDRR